MVLLWGDDKNTSVQQKHGVSFEQVEKAIRGGGLIAIESHPNQEKYPHQKVIYVDLDGYVCAVPCIPIENGYFLKTAYLSRTATKNLL